MSQYEKFWKGGYIITLRSDFREKLKDFLISPQTFIRRNTIRSYMTEPNLVAEVALTSGEKIVVKSFGWRSKFHFLLSPFRVTKAERSFKAAIRLIEHGVTTPSPVCVMVKRFLGFVVENIYITESIDNYITVREYLQKQPDGYENAHNILPELANYVRKIHDAGVWHRDLHLTNFLMKRDKDNTPVFYLVDLNRARFFNNLPFIFRIFDVGKMDVHEFRADFLHLYLQDVRKKVFWERIFYLYVLFRRLRKKVIKGKW